MNEQSVFSKRPSHQKQVVLEKSPQSNSASAASTPMSPDLKIMKSIDLAMGSAVDGAGASAVSSSHLSKSHKKMPSSRGIGKASHHTHNNSHHSRRPNSARNIIPRPIANCIKNCPITRTMMLRIILIGSLLTAAGVCAALAYNSLKQAELQTAVQTYNSVAAAALDNAKAIAVRKFQASEVTAELVSWTNPNEADWPFIYVNGYVNITGKIATLAQSTTQATMVFIEPEQVEEYEAHLKSIYAREGRPETTGVSEFGFGIWKPDTKVNTTYADARLHDTTGEVSYGCCCVHFGC
jgi:hypothetical protein